MAAFVPHRSNKYFHVIASNGIVSSSPYISRLHLQSHRFGYSKLSATRMSSRYVRCAPNAVGARSRDHRAERSSVLGICFWPLHRQATRSHRPSIAGTAMPLAAAPYRASGLVLWHFETFRRASPMSVHTGRPEVTGARSKGRLCEGFRMTADRDDAACTGAVVRKPPMKERA